MNSDNDKFGTITVKDEKQDDNCYDEIVGITPCLVDVPEYIDPKSLTFLMNQQKEELPPVVEKIVKTLSYDEEFDKECDKFYKANLDMDVEVVSVNVAKVLNEPVKLQTPSIKVNSNGENTDIRTQNDLPAICDLCEDSGDHIELLLGHFKENHHLKEGNYVCPFCDYTSPKHVLVMKHTTKVHKLNSEKLSCDQCEFQTFRGDLFNRHLKKHVQEKVYSCEKCNYISTNLINFKEHLSCKHTKETEFKCQYCDFKSLAVDSVKRHESSKHSKEHMLKFKNAQYKAHLDRQTSHDGELVFKCDKCDTALSTRQELVKHKKEHLHPCPKCNKLMKKSSIKAHLISHTDKYKCTDCPQSCNSRQLLEEHIRAVHTDIKPFVCENCGKNFSTSTSLKTHLLSHAEKRKYSCTICDYKGTTASAINIHMSKHENDTCVCELCSKVFKSNRNLYDHIRRVHNKIKKHVCSYCDKRFVEHYMLKIHTRTHTGVRPYQCDQCEKSFTRSDALKEHKITHVKKTT